MEIKQEVIEPNENVTKALITYKNDVITVSSSSSSDCDSNVDDCSDDDYDVERSRLWKKQKVKAVLPVGFLDPLTPEERISMQAQARNLNNTSFTAAKSNLSTTSLRRKDAEDNVINYFDSSELAVVKKEAVPLPVAVDGPPLIRSCKQFWKAGDYEGSKAGDSTSYTAGMDHVRVHPKFLHSNATSHKWALGAFAELLDNALDEVCNGATYVHIDMLENKKDKSKMLLVEDNGGGMTPDKMRQCMSLGYSEKSKMANTIGQYGNGFKTSTMRLGADVIVFSRCQGKDGTSTTQSIGLLSYTFLRSTGKEDIVVPIIDYKKCEDNWSIMTRSCSDDWTRNLDTIVRWSPYEDEQHLLQQFDFMKAQGTRIIIYSLWEDDQGLPELDCDADPSDIQIRGVNRDDKKIEMAKNYPNSRHFLTYRHSLRSYASILYLRIPPGFRIILRNKDVEHHNIVNDRMQRKEITYRPMAVPDYTPKDSNMVAVVSIGFVKDAKYHIDIQGFNVYHKNRLIKPFWRVWNAAGSDGRGVIGVLEANFVEPAHDKQGFERTIVLSRLETKLKEMQKNYWSSSCHLIGYAKRRHAKSPVACEKEATPPPAKDKSSQQPNSNGSAVNDRLSSNSKFTRKFKTESSTEDASDNETAFRHEIQARNQCRASSVTADVQRKRTLDQINDHDGKTTPRGENGHEIAQSGSLMIAQLKKENQELRESLEEVLNDLQHERDKNKLLENQLQEAQQTMDALDKDQELVLNTFLEERERRDLEEETMKKRLKNASDTIHQLISKVKLLENKAA